MCSPPDSFADDGPPTKRPWKTRQESYNEAINQPDGASKTEDWKNRQNSYLQENMITISLSWLTIGLF